MRIRMRTRTIVLVFVTMMVGCDLYPQLDPKRYGDGTPCSMEGTCPPAQACRYSPELNQCRCFSSDLGSNTNDAGLTCGATGGN
jgi:hypothetical protein